MTRYKGRARHRKQAVSLASIQESSTSEPASSTQIKAREQLAALFTLVNAIHTRWLPRTRIPAPIPRPTLSGTGGSASRTRIARFSTLKLVDLKDTTATCFKKVSFLCWVIFRCYLESAARKRELDGNLALEQERAETLEQENQSLRDENTGLVELQGSLNDRLLASKNDILERDGMVLRLERQIEALKEESCGRQETINSLNCSSKAQKEAAVKLQLDIQLKERGIDDLQREVQGLKKELGLLQQKSERQQKTIRGLRRNVRGRQKVITTLRNNIQMQQQEAQNTQEVNLGLEQVIKGLRKKNSNLEAVYQDMLYFIQETKVTTPATSQPVPAPSDLTTLARYPPASRSKKAKTKKPTAFHFVRRKSNPGSCYVERRHSRST
ncbi:hypothetical protein VTK73DRAFT_1329 [Phialemonium thermophilum]|uniref:Uncharacterized protein n=1 Tax=Phialemonium thermophilum TaxID=223376 RepID=A0ABR3XAX1_9PEZI